MQAQNEFPFQAPATRSTLSESPAVLDTDRVDTPKESPIVTPSPSRQPSVALFGPGAERDFQRHHEDEESFGLKRETLAKALDGTTGHVQALQQFNADKWTIHYPHQLGLTAGSSTNSSATAPAPRKGAAHTLRRSATMATEETSPTARPAPMRTYSTEVPAPAAAPVAPAHPLSILSLDLTLGQPSLPTAALPALLPTLSLSTLSALLSRRLTTSIGHLGSLKTRVMDTSSRLLITGDLNSGKSTFVNALLGREIMAVDQQPCTTVFCEVLDAESYNGGVEEVHAIRDIESYVATDKSTYDLFDLASVEEIQANEESPYLIIKAYVTDKRAEASFIKNGLVSISLIDAPGLNRDTLSTTALFARQAEIDVIVFVVSAENHFTLSAKEFLWSASREKAYVFVVVNKWAGIRDKKRCERTVGEQIRQLSPATWEAREELVHFVDAASAPTDANDSSVEEDNWTHLEQSLRSFVLLKRATSKLAPAKHYLLNLLSDLLVLAESNQAVATTSREEATTALERVKPIHERLESAREQVEHDVDAVEERVVKSVASSAWQKLNNALGRVEKGEGENVPEYPGPLAIWTWAADVKAALVKTLEKEIRAAEDEARTETAEGVKVVMDDMAKRFLPKQEELTVEQPTEQRVFKPEVMFAKRRRGVGKLAARGVASGLGLGTAGVGPASAAWTATDFDVSFLDLFDLERIWSFSGQGKQKGEESDTIEAGALISLGLGGVGMVGSRMIGFKGALDSISHVCELLGSKQAREWAAPVAAVLTLGVGAYLVYDLPRALPRNIGRKLSHALSSPTAPPTTFATAHSDRISRETRKVLRLAGWDLRERFRAALEQSAHERREVEEALKKAENALEWLGNFVGKVEQEEERVVAVEV